MTLIIIGIIVAGIVLAVVLNKKSSPESHSEPIKAQDPNVPVVEQDLVLIVEEPVATEEQKATRKVNAAKQAATKKPVAKPAVKPTAKKVIKKTK
jgi:hypothetical protein